MRATFALLLTLLAPALMGCDRDPPSVRYPVATSGYRLPVKGEWRVLRTHYQTKKASPQSHAVDLVYHGERGGKRGDPNEKFPTYRKEIVADGAGVIAVAVDGVPDNPKAGIVNRYDLHGNYVVIDHLNGEFSLFAHLIPGTVRVRPGQRVESGQLLGLCGNSGQSTMPHLHWQIMNHAYAHMALGVPVRFLPYINRGKPTTKRIDKGDIIQAIEPTER